MLPLAGVKVVEFCQVAAGPFCGLLLADLGADVIKVEHPNGGDSLRAWPPLNNGYSENFASLNRNKRSVALDLKNPKERDMAIALALSADVVVENNRPGVMARLGLDYESLGPKKPSLVYCSISAFGQSGPRTGEGGFDLTIQAMGGVMSVTGEPGGPPVKCGVPISDFATGLYGALAVVAALLKVRAGGEGEHVDASMLGSTLAIAALQTSEYFGTGNDPKKLGSAHPRNAPYQAFHAEDGYFAMAAGNQNLWRAVCEVVDRLDLMEDARFASPSLRAQHQEALRDILEVSFVKAPVETWIARFSERGVPCAPINSYSQVLADPQVAHMGWVQPVTLPNGEVTRTFISPLMFSGAALPLRLDPPALGAHTREVCESLGFEGAEPALSSASE